MFPTLYQFNDVIGFHTYGMFIVFAFLSAFVYSSNRARIVGIDSDELPLMYLLIAILGLTGTRVFYFLFSIPDEFFANPLIFFDPSKGGLVFYGGAIFGVLTGVIYCYIMKIDTWKLADIGGPAIMLGLGFGRIGCFFGGCCHGRPIETFVLQLKSSIPTADSHKLVSSSLQYLYSADEALMALAQDPPSAQAALQKIQQDEVSKLALQNLVAKIENGKELVSMPTTDGLKVASAFREVAENLSKSYSLQDFPKADAAKIAKAVAESYTDDAWFFLYSQADILKRVPRSLQDKALAATDHHSLSGDLFHGGDILQLGDSPHLALRFQPNVGVGSIFHVPTYPTQMWESTGVFCLFLALLWMWKKLRFFDGQILASTMIFYAGIRTTIENYRGDKIRGEDWVLGLSTSQLISVAMVAIAAVIIIIRYPKGVAPEVGQEGPSFVDTFNQSFKKHGLRIFTKPWLLVQDWFFEEYDDSDDDDLL